MLGRSALGAGSLRGEVSNRRGSSSPLLAMWILRGRPGAAYPVDPQGTGIICSGLGSSRREIVQTPFSFSRTLNR